MKKVLQLLCYVLFAVTAFQSEATAKELKCTVELQNLNIEAVLLPGSTRSYTVNVSCYIACTHHGEAFSKPILYNDTLTPVVVNETETSDDAAKAGEVLAARSGKFRLLEECMGNKCNCAEKGCSCTGCKKE